MISKWTDVDIPPHLADVLRALYGKYSKSNTNLEWKSKKEYRDVAGEYPKYIQYFFGMI